MTHRKSIESSSPFLASVRAIKSNQKTHFVENRIDIQKRYLTVNETARVLSVSTKTVYRAIAAGELPARRFRRSVRVPRYAVFLDGDGPGGGLPVGPARGTVRAAGRVASPEGN